ncbi:MFS transporter [Streptomyces badius]
MTVDTETRPLPAARHARAAVAVLFFTNGALFANLLPRYPQIKEDLAIGNGAYGLAVAAFPAGAITAGLAAGLLIRRMGSARAAVLGTLLTGAGILAAGLAPSVALLATALFLAGAMDALTDVAQNAHGLRVQRLYGRSILNSLHAVWSIGAVTGGLMAAGAMALGLSLGVHLAVSAVVLVAAAVAALRFCLQGRTTNRRGWRAEGSGGLEGTGPEQRGTEGARGASRVGLVLAALVLIATAGTLVEDAGNSWAALYLSDELHASAPLAAWGFIALVGAQFIGRAIGDRLVDRFGQRAVARAGGLITASGMGVALAVPTLPGTVLGFALAGFGVATLSPRRCTRPTRCPASSPARA